MRNWSLLLTLLGHVSWNLVLLSWTCFVLWVIATVLDELNQWVLYVVLLKLFDWLLVDLEKRFKSIYRAWEFLRLSR